MKKRRQSWEKKHVKQKKNKKQMWEKTKKKKTYGNTTVISHIL
jgi:hypothetical protein